jgi:hypothetical protein
VPGLETDRLRKNLKKPISGLSLKRRIEETEKQLETLVDKDLVVESEAGIETNQDKTNSQTQDIISTMVDKKNMVLPGSRDAPKTLNKPLNSLRMPGKMRSKMMDSSLSLHGTGCMRSLSAAMMAWLPMSGN